MTDFCAFGDADYESFQQHVQVRAGIRLCDYKSDQMRRRLTTLCAQAGCGSFREYAAAMEQDATLLPIFLDRMTINVTQVLRNPERFADLSEHILPDLLARRKGSPLFVWSAGCSYGAEAYTVAMLLSEIGPGSAHRIKGTDLDNAMVVRAQAACFTEADLSNLSLVRHHAHFSPAGPDTFRPNCLLQTMTHFSKHDLLTDPYPKSEYDLILCRNVLIYFTDEAKTRVARGLWRALRPGGVLFIGGTERLSDHHALGFELILPFFYRKPA